MSFNDLERGMGSGRHYGGFSLAVSGGKYVRYC